MEGGIESVNTDDIKDLLLTACYCQLNYIFVVTLNRRTVQDSRGACTSGGGGGETATAAQTAATAAAKTTVTAAKTTASSSFNSYKLLTPCQSC